MTSAQRFARAFAGAGFDLLPYILSEIGRARAIYLARRLILDTSTIESLNKLLINNGSPAAYSPELGISQLFLKRNDTICAKGQLACYMAEQGWKEPIEVTIEAPGYLYLGGTYIPVHGAIRIDGTAHGWELRCGQSRYVRRKKFSPERTAVWRTYAPAKGMNFGLTETGAEVDDGVFPSIWEYPQSRSRDEADTSLQSDIQHFYLACNALIETCAQHATWVNSLVRQVLFARLKDNSADTSGSSSSYPGCIYLNPHPTPLLTAEALVHEACHMALNAASDLAPIIKPGSNEVHYSPIKGVPRPIEMVYYAAHATANTAIFLSKAQKKRSLSEIEEKQLSTWMHWHGIYSENLRSSKSLTPFGRSIWDATTQLYQEHFDKCQTNEVALSLAT
ncbi:aKG-HExxH-type peptide beta-hydroxylase [Xanthomonas bonasiae]|uniref:aKG-HExxH-type peptide beta-hydroxylase n=1 Tax=Xanthomonas bonasiae TaxID=2810351 RepID=UPI00177FFB41|nr:HEXXH motif-containing putative peptide modification protein [Xanthomonas surreyensis]MBD7922486.1 hypothetical protein [Xanthomonas surreyensis]